MNAKKAGGRPRSGSLYWTKSGWRARMTIDVDGVAVQKSFNLETTDKQAARLKLRRLLKVPPPGVTLAAEAARDETVAEAVARIIERQSREGLKTAKERLSRLTKYALPELGQLSVKMARPAHIRAVLDAAGQLVSKQTVQHLKNDLSGVFGDLWRDEVLPENPVARVQLPKGLRSDRRPRIILTDSEFTEFADSPEVPERLQLMALVSRCFGGMRTSDLHAWDWSHIDTVNWQSARVYRPKTDGEDDGQAELAELEMPSVVEGPLSAWWTRRGRKTEGPVFPIVKGKKAGERQGKRSHVRELRHYLWLAGVRRPIAGYEEALALLTKAQDSLQALQRSADGKGKVRAARLAVRKAEAAAKACCALQTDTARTKATDFHSFRRAYNTALGAAGVNVQQAMALAGHSDPRTHMKYVDLAQRGALAIPSAALPVVSARPLLKPPSRLLPASQNPAVFTGDPDENRTRVIGVRGRRPNR